MMVPLIYVAGKGYQDVFLPLFSCGKKQKICRQGLAWMGPPRDVRSLTSCTIGKRV